MHVASADLGGAKRVPSIWHGRSPIPCKRIMLVTVSLMAALLSGCISPEGRNRPLIRHDPAGGYRFNALEPGFGNSDETFICLTFSGGGTRAAALAYGVLQGLRQTTIPSIDGVGQRHPLLDEVDLISSVSGGSFTAAAYGLEREGVFDGTFERGFLKKNIQSILFSLVLRPLNLLRLPSIVLDRIDLAAAYYDDQIFNRATFQDLLSNGRRPFLAINATNLSTGRRFEFTQDDFDLLGSDLASVPIGWAAAASSAYPLLLSPLRLAYYPGPEDATILADVLSDPDAQANNRRRYEWAADLIPPRTRASDAPLRLDRKAHRYLYLVDGGSADNLGLLYVIRAYQSGVISERIADRRIKRLVVIVVDAGTRPPQNMEALPSAPGIFRVGLQSADAGIRNYSDALLESIRHLMFTMPEARRQAAEPFRDALRKHAPEAPVPAPQPIDELEQYLVVVDFQQIADDLTRRRFLSMPTSFFLPRKDVDDLIAMGESLVIDHPEFRRLMKDLGDTTP